MALLLDIVPSSPSVDMYGSPDQTSTYSVSGHVVISLRSPSSVFGRQEPSLPKLQSLTLTFEGQSELLTDPTGYAGARLFTLTEELVRQPYELFYENQEDIDRSIEWHVSFDLRIPGWLPPSDVFGDCSKSLPGTRYALYATAKISSPSNPGSWISFCTPSFFRLRTVDALPYEIVVNRYAIPPLADGSWPMASFGVTPLPLDQQPGKALSNTNIPLEVFEKLEVLVSIPHRISVDQSSFPLNIRIRAPQMDSELAARFRIPEFSIVLDQVDRYRSALGSWGEKYPIPKESCQPPRVPLRSSHPMRALYDLGICAAANNTIIQDTFTLLREGHVAKYQLDGTRPVFSEIRPDAWFSMRTKVGFAKDSIEQGRWIGAHKIRPTGAGPFLEVRHQLRLSISCVVEGVDGAPDLRECLQFSLPIEFVQTRQTKPTALATQDSTTPIKMPALVPYDLPVYSHLYHSNGERKIDHSEQLPLYSSTPDESCPLLADTETQSKSLGEL